MSNLEVKKSADGRPNIVVDGKVMFRCMGNGQGKLARKMVCAEEMLEALEFCSIRMHRMLVSEDKVQEIKDLIKKAKGE